MYKPSDYLNKQVKREGVKVEQVPLYPCSFGVIVVDDFDNANNILKSQGLPDDIDFDGYNALCIRGTCYDEEGDLVSCIWVVFNTHYFTHSIIAHEVRHAVNYILNRIGHKLDAENDEPEAYLAGWDTNVVYRCISEAARLSDVRIKQY